MSYGITTSDGLYQIGNTMEDVNKLSWGRDAASYDALKSAGGIGIATAGAANAIYGPMLANLPYLKANALGVLGEKPYKTGRRFMVKLSMGRDDTGGIIRGGYPTATKSPDYAQVLMPYKLNAVRRMMTLGMMEIGNKDIDDVVVWEQFFKNEGLTWTQSMNNDILRRIEDAPIIDQGTAPVGGTPQVLNERVGLESIERIISCSAEAECLPEGYAVPWAGSNMGGETNAAWGQSYRGRVGSAPSNFDAYVDSNYVSGSATGESNLRPLTLNMMDSLFMGVMPWWENNRSSGKALITGYDTVQKIQQMGQSLQRFLDTKFAQLGVNGVSTVEGRELGFQVVSYNNVPIVPDMLVRKGTKADDTLGIGRIYLVDQDIIYQGKLRQPTVTVSDNTIVNNQYVRLADMNVLSEIQVAGAFKGLGKIVHIN